MSLTLLLAATIAAPGAIDQDRRWRPNAQDRARVEQSLRRAGYERWDDIEFDDGYWEVDDARARQGGEYDLKIDPRTLRIVSRDGDRPANPRERAMIERSLRAQGYTRWDSIRWDADGYWEVEDARRRGGGEDDLKLDRRGRIIDRD